MRSVKTIVVNQIQKQTNKHRKWWSQFTDEESMPILYTKEWINFNWGNLVWSKNV